MSYYKTIDDGFISQIGSGDYGTAISEQEYNDLLAIIQAAPTAPTGYAYKLRADNLEWELVELPPEPELTAEEALDILLGGGDA